MLWYKAWRESRARFLICAGVVAGICTLGVLFQNAARAQLDAAVVPNTYIGYVYHLTYSGTVRGLFGLFAGVLGLGGLQRERALSTAGFTLALPVSRIQLITARAGAGIVQIAVLSLLPAMLIPALSALVGESYPLSQTLQFSVLWFIFGVSGFAAWFLASTIFASELTALAVCFAVGFLEGLATQVTPLRAYHLSGNYIMSGFGMPYFDARTDLLIGPLPWGILLATTLEALVFLAAAGRVTQKRDFS
jgi:ABC-2 type transport system permease protein